MPPRVLVALCGLLRSYQLTWPVISRQLRLDALSAEGRAETDVLVLTSLTSGCSESDVAHGLCPLEWAKMGQAERSAELNVTIGPRLRLIHHADLSLNVRRFGRALEARALNFIESRLLPTRQKAHKKPTTAELTAAAASFFDVYEIVVFVRPDVILVPPAPRSVRRALDTFDLLHTCKAFPGFQLISGSLYRDFWYHARDWDFMHVICPPVHVADWLLLNAAPNETCRAFAGCRRGTGTHPPTRPPGYSGEWYSSDTLKPKGHICTMPASKLCDRVVYFLSRNLPMLALPDALAFAHLVKMTRPQPGTTATRSTTGLAVSSARAAVRSVTASTNNVSLTFPAKMYHKSHPNAFMMIDATNVSAAGAAAQPSPERLTAAFTYSWPWSWVPCTTGLEDERGLLCADNARGTCVQYIPLALGGANVIASPSIKNVMRTAHKNATTDGMYARIKVGEGVAQKKNLIVASSGARSDLGVASDIPHSVDRSIYRCCLRRSALCPQ